MIRQLVNISCLRLVGYISGKDFIISAKRDPAQQRFAFKKMVYQEDHRFSILTMWRYDLIQLVKTSSSIHYIIHHLKVPEFHNIRSDPFTIIKCLSACK